MLVWWVFLVLWFDQGTALKPEIWTLPTKAACAAVRTRKLEEYKTSVPKPIGVSPCVPLRANALP